MKIQKWISFPPSRIKHPSVSISLCLTLVGKTFYEKLRIKNKGFCSNYFLFLMTALEQSMQHDWSV